MGYTTDFDGEFRLSRTLSIKEYKLLMDLHEERHGDNTRHDPKFPGFYCQWVPGEDGDTIHWDGGEKFYEYVEWMNHIIKSFLIPWGVKVSGKVHYQGERNEDHGNLIIRDGLCVQVPDAEGEDMADRLEEYVAELNDMKDPLTGCSIMYVPVSQVIDRLSAILYGDPS